jgi:hypothetical protein
MPHRGGFHHRGFRDFRPGPMGRHYRNVYPGWYLPYQWTYYPYNNVDQTPVKQPPTYWIGKYMVRTGRPIPRNIPDSEIILENSIFEPHQVVGSTEMSYDYDPDRLLIYINKGNRVENVRYG